jgi:hypothetical protein
VREGGSGMEYYSIPRLQNINTLYIYIYTNQPCAHLHLPPTRRVHACRSFLLLFSFFAIILHTRFQFRNDFHHNICDIFMHNLRSIVNIVLNFLNSKFYMTIDARTTCLYYPDYMFVLPSRHVCRIWTMSLYDSDCRFV